MFCFAFSGICVSIGKGLEKFNVPPVFVLFLFTVQDNASFYFHQEKGNQHFKQRENGLFFTNTNISRGEVGWLEIPTF